MSDTLFTWGPANVTTLLTTTMANRDITELQDAVFNDLATLNYLADKKKIRRAGGTSIIVPIRSSINSTAGAYDGYEVILTDPQENETAGQFKWKQYAASVSVSGREDRIQNVGKYEVLNLVQTKIKDAEDALRNKLNQALFAASPASKELGSLVTSIDATSSIGDVNSTTSSFWQSLVTSGGAFSTQGVADMRTTWNSLAVRMPQKPTDMIMTNTTIHGYYENTLIANQRYLPQNRTGNSGFDDLMFKSSPVRFDAQSTSGVMYFLNSDVMELVIDQNTDFKMTEWVKPVNQDSKTAQYLMAGELVIKNRRKLGKITGITA